MVVHRIVPDLACSSPTDTARFFVRDPDGHVINVLSHS